MGFTNSCTIPDWAWGK